MVTVPAASDMDDETLTKHMNARHVATDYSGLRALAGGLQSTYDRSAREHYHNYCHEFGDYDHDHREQQ